MNARSKEMRESGYDDDAWSEENDFNCSAKCYGSRSFFGDAIFCFSLVMFGLAVVEFKSLREINESDLSDAKEFNERQADPFQNGWTDESGPRTAQCVPLAFSCIFCCSNPCFVWFVSIVPSPQCWLSVCCGGISCSTKMAMSRWHAGIGNERMEARNRKAA